MPATLDVQDLAGHVRALTLGNPAKKNAIDPPVLEALARALADGRGVRAWLVRAAGHGVFSAGFDLSALDTADGRPLPDERLAQVLGQLAAHPAPSVALVEGLAIGAGCELALACDFRVGGPGATFCMPPARLGVVYSLAGLERVVARVGEQQARLLFLTGRRVHAPAAQAMGLLTELAEKPEGPALALCAELAQNAPLALAGLKRGLELTRRPALEEVTREGFEAQRRASFQSEDAAEGVRAAREKRAPVFHGR